MPEHLAPHYHYSTGLSDGPYLTQRVHDVGRLHLTVTNWGLFGSMLGRITDPLTGLSLPGATFPADDNLEYLGYGGLWVGGVVSTIHGDDTLVSTEFNPTEFYPGSLEQDGDIIEWSSFHQSPHYDERSITIQEFHCSYTDTLSDPAYVPFDPSTMQPHRPLGIRIRQHSYVWAGHFAEDFVIIEYWIINMRRVPLPAVRAGIHIVPSVHHRASTDESAGQENMVGYLRTYSAITGYGVDVPISTAWWADNDGDPGRHSWDEQSVRSGMGVRFLGLDNESGKSEGGEHSFNWWANWGPQRKPGDKSIDGKNGPPWGDHQKYRYMANREIDYDQYLAHDTIAGWITPPDKSWNTWPPYILSDGDRVSFLLSTGPYYIAPGDSVCIPMAIVAGDFLHPDPINGSNLKADGQKWYDNLDFSALAYNAQRAEAIYDNPGVDTDGDGHRGRSYTVNCREVDTCFTDFCYYLPDTFYCYEKRCFEDYPVCDTIYYSGDGVPDLKGPAPPPSPAISLATEPHTVRIRWSGKEIEHIYDPFSEGKDFEGYNVYSGLGYSRNEMELIASWDIVNYDRYKFVAGARPRPWTLDGPPLTPEQVAAQHDPSVNPLDYPNKFNPYEDKDGNLYYFRPHGGNRGNVYREGGTIVTNPIQYIRTDSLWDRSSRMWKYFGQYECTINNLLPSQAYYFSVTAFDAGIDVWGIESLESPVEANVQLAYPTYSPEYVQENRLKVSVYPNPYKIDANYRGRGFEDPLKEGFKERERRIHFVNLPPECTIKIFSLDGDLIRQLHHPTSRFSDTPSHTAWDLITRNTQAVQSGIYLYTVESEWGTQVGKFVIIK